MHRPLGNNLARGYGQSVPESYDKIRAKNLRGKYGMGIDEYEHLLQQQGGVCAICHRAPVDRALHVDHDHTTGQVRGLLCAGCNIGMGYFNDNAFFF